MVMGWEELHCLSFDVVDKKNDRYEKADVVFSIIDLSEFQIKEIKKLIYIDDGFSIACGMKFKSKGGDMYICGGKSIGSVSAKIPGVENFGDFMPEIKINCCKEIPF